MVRRSVPSGAVGDVSLRPCWMGLPLMGVGGRTPLCVSTALRTVHGAQEAVNHREPLSGPPRRAPDWGACGGPSQDSGSVGLLLNLLLFKIS